MIPFTLRVTVNVCGELAPDTLVTVITSPATRMDTDCAPVFHRFFVSVVATDSDVAELLPRHQRGRVAVELVTRVEADHLIR
jgi:hypothetical protein